MKRLMLANYLTICARYPLFFEYMLTDNEKYGISFMIKNFNGLKELSSRKDGTMKLLKLYSNIKVLEDPFLSNLDTLSSPLHL